MMWVDLREIHVLMRIRITVDSRLEVIDAVDELL